MLEDLILKLVESGTVLIYDNLGRGGQGHIQIRNVFLELV